MVISNYAMDLSLKKAKKYGMAMAVVRNSSHNGMVGYYGKMAA